MASIATSVGLLLSYYRIPSDGTVTLPPTPPLPPGTRGDLGLIAQYTYSRPSPQANIPIQFNSAGYAKNGAIVSWLWDFGDGTTSTLQNPSHTYATDETYNVTLTVTDDQERTNMVDATVRVFTADYTIRDNAGVYEAANSGGTVDFSNADATLVIQYAIDQLAPVASAVSPKNIFIEDGIYPLTYQGSSPEPHSIWISQPADRDAHVDYLNIEGASWNTILETNNGDYNAIYFRAFDPPSIGCRIANLQIDGGSTTQHPTWNIQNGIQTRQTHYAIFENLWIHHMGRTAMYNTEGGNYNTIRNNVFEYNCRYAISYTSSHGSLSNPGHVHHNFILYNGNPTGWGVNWDATYGMADYCIFEYNLYRDNLQADIAMFTEPGSPPLQHGRFRYEIIESTLERSPFQLKWGTSDVEVHDCLIEHTGSAEAVKFADGVSDVNFHDNEIIASNIGIGLHGAGDAAPNLIQNNNITAPTGIIVGDAHDTKIVGNKIVGETGIQVNSAGIDTIIGQLSGEPVEDQNDFSLITGTPIENNGTGTTIGNNILP